MSVTEPSKLTDRYRLVAPLGQGGMGRVWKARDEVLQRDVAIKELVAPAGLTGDERREMRERMLREARAVAQLSHANVVRVFDVLRIGDGDPWIVMEYVPGRSLDEVVNSDGPLEPVAVARIGLQLLDALRAAHRAGIAHRDVKPANVLLAEDGRVVLTDFGIATLSDHPSVTSTGVVLGSPAFTAPERARSGVAGPQSDLWSLGATLFAAVEGHAPYARPSTMETLTALAMEPLPEPQRAGPLKAVLQGLLRKDPANRLDAVAAEQLLRRVVGPRANRMSSIVDALRGRRELSTSAGKPVPPPPIEAAPVPVPAPASATPPPAPSEDVTPVRSIGRVSYDDSSGLPRDSSGRRRKALLIGVVAVALAVVAGLILLPKLLSNPSTKQSQPPAQEQPTPQTTPTNTAAASSPTAAPATPSPPTTGFVLPAGWQWRDDGTGFRLPVPVGWQFGRDDDGRALWRDPQRSRLLLIDQTRKPKPDPYQDWLDNEAARRDGYRDYRRIRLEPVDYWDKAADWEFTYTSSNGNPLHVLNRGFITAPDQAYSIYWSTPADAWQDNLDELKVIHDGFQPARS